MHVQFNSQEWKFEVNNFCFFVFLFLFEAAEKCKPALSEKMVNTGLCTVILYLGLKGLSPKEVHEDVVATLGEGALSYSMVKKWTTEIRCG